jgi:rod shape-determining protein MreC
VFAILAGCALTVLGRSDLTFIRNSRLTMLDMLAPALTSLSRPIETFHRLSASVSDYLSLRSANEELKRENALLQVWQKTAWQLKQENDRLRALAHFQPPPQATFVTAPVIAELAGGYTRALIVLAGEDNRITPNQAVVTERGLVGRILDVGEHASRALLLTDINSHLPVVIERSKQNAILSGTSEGATELTLLSVDADVRIDDRIVTSGAGGAIPPGLPVGRVAHVEGRKFDVALYADLDQLDYVQIVNYGVEAILQDLPPSLSLRKNSQ